MLFCESGCFVSELGLGVCNLGNLLDVIRQSGTYKITPSRAFGRSALIKDNKRFWKYSLEKGACFLFRLLFF